jgi:CheY-like chemotaxis protein/lipopolysaccharide biosynthesis regulator YciM
MIQAAAEPIDYKSKTALVVDDYPNMRSAFRTALSAFGLTKVDMAATAAEAIGRVKNSHYDIIISDYNLGDGRDGQQVLEEMRHLGLIGLETAFLMVTAESVYERVVAAAELAPDDYLIKPFNADIMRARLDSILAKKQTFAGIYDAFARGNLEDALAGCDELIGGRSKYLVDAMRLKGEILVAMGHFDEASELYDQVVKLRAVPWARLGLARTMHMRNKPADAETMLVDLVGEYPELVSGYDLLADVQLAQQKQREAQMTLKQGVATSPKSLLRQRRLGEVAYQNGDLAGASAAFDAAVQKGRHSIFLQPNDFANLSRVYVDQGSTKEALRVLQDNRKYLQESDEGKLVTAVMAGLAHSRAGNEGEAKRLAGEAMKLRETGASGRPELLLDMAENCLKAGMGEEAARLVSEVARNAHDSESLITKAKQLYEKAGRPDEAEKVIRQATEHVQRLSKEGALLAQRGDLESAARALIQAAEEAPRNPRVLMNAAWAGLRLLEKEPDHSLPLSRIRMLLDDATYLAPDHPRLAGLESKLRTLEKVFGVTSPGRATRRT